MDLKTEVDRLGRCPKCERHMKSFKVVGIELFNTDGLLIDGLNDPCIVWVCFYCNGKVN